MTRWLLQGTLTSLEPLHIGSGTPVPTTLRAGDKAEEVEVNACVRDVQGNPYIPGSTLKGCLRAWLASRADAKGLTGAFGAWDQKPSDPAGAAEFEDAYLDGTHTPAHPPSWWDEGNQTGVEVAVSLDRVTRTAAEQRLFHAQVVPPGARFKIAITCDGDEDSVPLLLAGLAGFNDSADPIRLGGDNASGHGRLEWKILSVKQFGPSEFAAFWERAQKGSVTWMDCAVPVKGSPAALGAAAGMARLAIHLEFQSPFLVNDPSRRVAKKEKTNNAPDFTPVLDAHGKAVLPARSFRGALRAQAERIIRTLGGNACNPASKDACKPIEDQKDLHKLCLACQVFGAPGWKSPLTITNFTLKACKKEDYQQEFVAIDRFDGGGRDGAKFNAAAVDRPSLGGDIVVDIQRMPLWGFGLVLLTLRDLAEGDVTFGYGRSKGYGACRATLGDAGALFPNADFWIRKLFSQLPMDPGLKNAGEDHLVWAKRVVAEFRARCSKTSAHK